MKMTLKKEGFKRSYPLYHLPLKAAWRINIYKRRHIKVGRVYNFSAGPAVLHHQVDGPAANAQKAGHTAQRQADDCAGRLRPDPVGGDAGLVQRVQKGAHRDYGQAGGLNRPHPVGIV